MEADDRDRQPRVEDEEASEPAIPTATVIGKAVEFVEEDGDAGWPRAESRPRSQDQASSTSSPCGPDVEELSDESFGIEERQLVLQTIRPNSSRERGRQYSPASAPKPPPIWCPQPGNYSPSRIPHRSRLQDYSPSTSHDSSCGDLGGEYSPSYTSESRSRSPSEGSMHDIDFDENEPRSPEEPLPQEWSQPRAVLGDGTATELLVAQSIEHRVSKAGSEKIVLVSSPPRPPPLSAPAGQGREESREHFRWLHVQPKTSRGDVEHAFQMLERFVLNCPFISARIRPAALLFLRGSAWKEAKLAESVASGGRALKYSRRETLASATHQHQRQSLHLSATQVLFFGPLGEARSYTRTLLRATRGYDVGNDRELSQVARKMGAGGARDVLQAATLWSLSVGPGVMITLCCLPAADLCGDLIKVDDRAGNGFYTIQVKLHDSEFCCNIVIDPDCSYVDFLQHAIAAATSGTRRQDATTYDLLYDAHTSDDAEKGGQLEFLTPLKWLKLLASDGVESHTFYLKQKFRARSRSRRLYHHRRSSSRNRRRSYREPPSRLLDPPPMPTQYGYSGPAGREESHKKKALVGWGKHSRAVGRTGDAATRPEPAFVGNPRENQSGLDSGQPQQIRTVPRHVWRDNSPGPGTRGRRAAPPRPRRPRSDSDSGDTPTAEQEAPPLDASGAVSVPPFFAWRLKSDKYDVGGDQGDSTRPATADTIHNVLRILRKINDSLLSSELEIGGVYSQAYKCTEENLLKRHPELAREMFPASPTAAAKSNISGSARGGVGQDEQTDREGSTGNGDNRQPPAPSQPPSAEVDDANQQTETARHEKTVPSTSPAGTQGPAGRSASITMMHPADVLGRQLLEISQTIIGRFLPKDEPSASHVVCERFWGSVDEAIRQIRWSTEPSGALWTVRDFDTMSGAGSGGVMVKKPHAGCTACRSPATKYPSASAALEHLHAEHLECSFGESPAGRTQDRPHDDPCYAYIKSLADTHANEPEIERIANEFIDHLSDFSGSLSKIQWLVATNLPRSSPRGRTGLHSYQPPTAATRQPQLHRSLVHAFDDIVAYYILQAKRISLQNRGIGLNMRDKVQESLQALARSTSLGFHCRDARAHVQSYLQQARRDVILSRGGNDTDTALGVQAFDRTSFVRALVLSAVDTTFSAPLVQKKPRGPQGPEWEVLGMYSEYNKRLHVEAARRPRRRLFLEIHALEDELESLEELLDGNLYLIQWTLSEFPHSDSAFTNNRQRLAPAYREWKRQYREERTMEAERHYLLSRKDALEAKLDEVARLQKSASALRERVGQLIEIMDEDHGKAIRVFTIVTVLFLPMTFVSGFLGMNTADIRDMDASQSLYWTVAIPVTVTVLAVAFVYGYKGDEIGDWIHDRIRARNDTWLSRPAEVAETRKPPICTHEVWRAARNSVRRRSRRSDPNVMRRPTFQSDTVP